MSEIESDGLASALERVLKSPTDASILEDLGRLSLEDIDLDILGAATELAAIPGLGAVFTAIKSLTRTALNIRERFFIKKLLRFIREAHTVPQQQREEFLAQNEKDAQSRQRVTETLLIVLEHFDHITKAELLGIIFAARMRGELGEKQFLRMASGIDNAYIDDLLDLLRNHSEYPPTLVSLERLHACGFSEVSLKVERETEFQIITKVDFDYEVSALGFSFAKIVLGERILPWHR